MNSITTGFYRNNYLNHAFTTPDKMQESQQISRRYWEVPDDKRTSTFKYNLEHFFRSFVPIVGDIICEVIHAVDDYFQAKVIESSKLLTDSPILNDSADNTIRFITVTDSYLEKQITIKETLSNTGVRSLSGNIGDEEGTLDIPSAFNSLESFQFNLKCAVLKKQGMSDSYIYNQLMNDSALCKNIASAFISQCDPNESSLTITMPNGEVAVFEEKEGNAHFCIDSGKPLVLPMTLEKLKDVVFNYQALDKVQEIISGISNNNLSDSAISFSNKPKDQILLRATQILDLLANEKSQSETKTDAEGCSTKFNSTDNDQQTELRISVPTSQVTWFPISAKFATNLRSLHNQFTEHVKKHAGDIVKNGVIRNFSTALGSVHGITYIATRHYFYDHPEPSGSEYRVAVPTTNGETAKGGVLSDVTKNQCANGVTVFSKPVADADPESITSGTIYGIPQIDNRFDQRALFSYELSAHLELGVIPEVMLTSTGGDNTYSQEKASGISCYQWLKDNNITDPKVVPDNIVLGTLDLQLGDVLAGQVDRHGDNYFIDSEQASKVPVSGIDCDQCGGLTILHPDQCIPTNRLDDTSLQQKDYDKLTDTQKMQVLHLFLSGCEDPCKEILETSHFSRSVFLPPVIREKTMNNIKKLMEPQYRIMMQARAFSQAEQDAGVSRLNAVKAHIKVLEAREKQNPGTVIIKGNTVSPAIKNTLFPQTIVSGSQLSMFTSYLQRDIYM